MQQHYARLLDLESDDLHDEATLEAALETVPPPRSPHVLLDKLRALGVTPDDVVVDVGCGHGDYARQIASMLGCTVVAVDLSPLRAAETKAATASDARVHVAQAVAEALPLRDGSAGYIWCRASLNSVDLPQTVGACARILRAGGHMVVYDAFATELLAPGEEQRLRDAFEITNLDAPYFEWCARNAGFAIVERDEIGSEWREWWLVEGSRDTGTALLTAARLIRGGGELRARMGDRAYEFALADQLWGVYQMIGKLMPTAYVPQRR
jgi:SAM-dependent methyltransferase